MTKVNTKVMSGFVELSPTHQAIFDTAKKIVREVYERRGYQNTDTPAIERTEVLLSKSGGETEKQIYYIDKDGHDRDMALRFDLTVPFARYVAGHYGELKFPFKRCQVEKVWRGERAQKGRYREFYQADVDVVAEGDLPLAYDADIIATLAEALGKLTGTFGLGRFKIRLSNREVWTDAGLKQLPEIMALVDRRLKMSADEFDAELSKLPEADKVKKILYDNGKDHAALGEVYDLLKSAGVPVEIDVSIVRGLDYYTGTVFETFLDEHPGLGSIASGGRYANLVGDFMGRNIIGVGGSIGLSRSFVPLIEEGAITMPTAGRTVIIPKTPEQNKAAFLLAGSIPATAIYTNKEVKKPLELAAKHGANRAIIVNDDGTTTEKELT